MIIKKLMQEEGGANEIILDDKFIAVLIREVKNKKH